MPVLVSEECTSTGKFAKSINKVNLNKQNKINPNKLNMRNT